MTLYVGNRYIPLPCGDWDNSKNTSYESLSVVLYSGNSYTAKQFVPKGIEINNTNFWVKSSDFSVQLQNYENQLNAFTLSINTLVNEYKTSVDGYSDLIEANKEYASSMLSGLNSDLINKIELAKIELGATDDAIISLINTKVASVYKYKASVATYASLPISGNIIGDVYNVITGLTSALNGMNYSWNGTSWDTLGSTIDLSIYYNKTEVDAKHQEVHDTINTYRGDLNVVDANLQAQITADKAYSTSMLSGVNSDLINRIAIARTALEGTDDAIIAMINAIPTKNNMVLENNWVEYDNTVSSPQYYKEYNGIVHLKGSIKNGTMTGGLSICTLPVGFRPSKVVVANAMYNSTVPTLTQININTSGVVSLGATITTNAQLNLDGITFSI